MREAVWIHIYTSNEFNFISQNHHYPRQDEMFPAVFSAITFVCGWNELCTVDNQPAGCGVWPDTRQLEALCHQDTAAVGLVLKCLILYSELHCSYIHTHTRLMAVWAGWASTRKVKPICILLKQETVSGSGISWAICKFTPDRQLCQHPTTQFFTGRMPLLPPNQQRQSAEGSEKWSSVKALQLIMW